MYDCTFRTLSWISDLVPTFQVHRSYGKTYVYNKLGKKKIRAPRGNRKNPKNGCLEMGGSEVSEACPTGAKRRPKHVLRHVVSALIRSVECFDTPALSRLFVERARGTRPLAVLAVLALMSNVDPCLTSKSATAKLCSQSTMTTLRRDITQKCSFVLSPAVGVRRGEPHMDTGGHCIS